MHESSEPQPHSGSAAALARTLQLGDSESDGGAARCRRNRDAVTAITVPLDDSKRLCGLRGGSHCPYLGPWYLDVAKSRALISTTTRRDGCPEELEHAEHARIVRLHTETMAYQPRAVKARQRRGRTLTRTRACPRCEDLGRAQVRDPLQNGIAEAFVKGLLGTDRSAERHVT